MPVFSVSLSPIPLSPSVCDNCQQSVTLTSTVSGYFAHVGFARHGARRQLNIQGASVGQGTFIHEVGHVLGLEHDHQHPQREVVILRDGINPHDWHNYDVIYDSERGPYDKHSIMHYGPSKHVCLPKARKGPIRLRFCDVYERFKFLNHRSWCTSSTEARCDRTRDNEFGPGRRF